MTRLFILLMILSIPMVAHSDDRRTVRNMAYTQHDRADAKSTSLDIYAPTEGADHPILIWIHGGGWRIGDKSRMSGKPEAFVDQKDFVLVSINYRLDSDADYKDQAGDVAKAIHWVREHATEYGGSPDKIFLMGHSAGAHLAALTAIDERYLEAESLKLDSIKGVILLDGAGYDIPRQIELAALPRMKKLYREVFSEDPEKQKDASPITHVAKDKKIPPFLILYVSTRRDSRLQSEALADKLNDAGAHAEVFPAENKTHGTINKELGEADDVPTEQVYEFLDRQLKPTK